MDVQPEPGGRRRDALDPDTWGYSWAGAGAAVDELQDQVGEGRIADALEPVVLDAGPQEYRPPGTRSSPPG